jgi:Raf kinase inhibitor-like YbhB/YbcL family protein
MALAAMLVLVAACETATDSEPAPGSTSRERPTQEDSTMQLTSTAFTEGETIPVRYTCDGDDVSPPLLLTGVPDGTAVLVLIMDDPDAPGGTWDHWVAFDIPVTGSIPDGVASLGVAGRNSWGRTGYGGPCPPSGVHRYVFKVMALSEPVGLGEGATKADVLAAARPVTLAESTLTGRYGR